MPRDCRPAQRAPSRRSVYRAAAAVAPPPSSRPIPGRLRPRNSAIRRPVLIFDKHKATAQSVTAGNSSRHRIGHGRRRAAMSESRAGTSMPRSCATATETSRANCRTQGTKFRLHQGGPCFLEREISPSASTNDPHGLRPANRADAALFSRAVREKNIALFFPCTAAATTHRVMT